MKTHGVFLKHETAYRKEKQSTWLQEIGDTLGITHRYQWVLATVLALEVFYILVVYVFPRIGFLVEGIRAVN